MQVLSGEWLPSFCIHKGPGPKAVYELPFVPRVTCTSPPPRPTGPNGASRAVPPAPHAPQSAKPFYWSDPPKPVPPAETALPPALCQLSCALSFAPRINDDLILLISLLNVLILLISAVASFYQSILILLKINRF